MTVDHVPQRAPAATYTHGYGVAAQVMADRTAEAMAAFFLAHLRPGMRLLDVGCGPGSITLGFAQIVAPGEVIGVDLEPAMIERARALAVERGIANVRFDVADAAHLPFPDGSFDAVFESTVLEHVADPAAVVGEMRRVLTPGGIIGLRDGDWGARIQASALPLVHEAYARYIQLIQRNGGHPFVGRQHRALLHEAGFERIEIRVVPILWASDERMRHWGQTFATLFLEPRTIERMAAHGLADRAAMERYAATLRAWGGEPGAVDAGLDFRSLGWLP